MVVTRAAHWRADANRGENETGLHLEPYHTA
jgi:hypothetical protein